MAVTAKVHTHKHPTNTIGRCTIEFAHPLRETAWSHYIDVRDTQDTPPGSEIEIIQFGFLVHKEVCPNVTAPERIIALMRQEVSQYKNYND